MSIEEAGRCFGLAKSSTERYLSLVNFFTDHPRDGDLPNIGIGQFYSTGVLKDEPEKRAKVLSKSIDLNIADPTATLDDLNELLGLE